MTGLGRRIGVDLPVGLGRPGADEVGRDRDVAPRARELDRAREGAHRRDGQWRIGLLIGLGHVAQPDILVDPVLEGDLPVLAVELVGRVGGPDVDHDVDGFDHHGVPVRVHHAEDLEVGRQPAGADAGDVASLRQVVEHRDLPGRDRRVVLRQTDDAGAADDLLGLRQQMREEEQRRGDLLRLGAVVLAHPGLREAQPVSMDDRFDILHEGRVIVPRVVVDRHHEQAKLHRSPPLPLGVARGRPRPARPGADRRTIYHHLRRNLNGRAHAEMRIRP